MPTFTLGINGGQLSPVLRVKQYGIENQLFVGVKKSSTSVSSVCPTPARPRNLRKQFYATGQKARVFARKFRTTKSINFFRQPCVKLTLTNIQLNFGGNMTYLSPGDGNTLHRESRRCIVFKTK